MAMIKRNEIKSLTHEQIQEKKKELEKEMLKLNAQRAIGTTMENPGRIKLIRRTIAKLLTFENMLKSKTANQDNKANNQTSKAHTPLTKTHKQSGKTHNSEDKDNQANPKNAIKSAMNNLLTQKIQEPNIQVKTNTHKISKKTKGGSKKE